MIERNRGYTLVELQVAIVIAVIVTFSIIGLYVFSMGNFNIGNTLLDVYINSRNACGWLTRDIRCARLVLPEVTLDSGITYYTDIDNTGDSHSIVLRVPSIDDDGESIKDPSGSVIEDYVDYIVYQLEGNDLRRIIQIDPRFNAPSDPYYHKNGRHNEDKVLAKYCSSLIFTYYNASGGKVTDLDLGTADIVAIYLPINKTTLSLSGSGSEIEWINPTTKVRLRNKQLN